MYNTSLFLDNKTIGRHFNDNLKERYLNLDLSILISKQHFLSCLSNLPWQLRVACYRFAFLLENMLSNRFKKHQPGITKRRHSYTNFTSQFVCFHPAGEKLSIYFWLHQPARGFPLLSCTHHRLNHVSMRSCKIVDFTLVYSFNPMFASSDCSSHQT